MSRPPYPFAQRDDIVDVLHGHRVADPYRWLEERDDETGRLTAAQEELFHKPVDGLPGRDRLRRRLGELLGAGSVGSPVWRGDRRFFTRRDGGQVRKLSSRRRPGQEGEEPSDG